VKSGAQVEPKTRNAHETVCALAVLFGVAPEAEQIRQRAKVLTLSGPMMQADQHVAKRRGCNAQRFITHRSAVTFIRFFQ